MAHPDQTPANIKASLKLLKQSLLFPHPANHARAFAQLYAAGPLAVGLLLKELRAMDLSKASHPEAVNLVGGLSTLLHELDETASAGFINDALEAQCAGPFAVVLQSVLRFSKANYRISEDAGLQIFEEKQIDPGNQATRQVREWLDNVPRDYLKDMPRLYIIAANDDQDFVGAHHPHTGTIALVWRPIHQDYFLKRWATSISTEFTLYHEIGHYTHKHTEGGQVPEQEEQANNFAKHMMRRAHPRMRLAARIWGAIVFLYRKIRPQKN